MKKKIGNIFLILLACGILLYFLISAVMDLTNKKDLYTVQIAGAFELLEVEHSINGLIPTGKDYYYVGIDKETSDAYIIKASKKWFGKNFGSNHITLDANGMMLTALRKKASDYQVSLELASRVSRFEALKFPLENGHYLDLGYKKKAAQRIIVFILSICLAISGFYFYKKSANVKPIFIKCWIVTLMVCLVLMIGVVR